MSRTTLYRADHLTYFTIHITSPLPLHPRLPRASAVAVDEEAVQLEAPIQDSLTVLGRGEVESSAGGGHAAELVATVAVAGEGAGQAGHSSPEDIGIGGEAHAVPLNSLRIPTAPDMIILMQMGELAGEGTQGDGGIRHVGASPIRLDDTILVSAAQVARVGVDCLVHHLPPSVRIARRVQHERGCSNSLGLRGICVRHGDDLHVVVCVCACV